MNSDDTKTLPEGPSCVSWTQRRIATQISVERRYDTLKTDDPHPIDVTIDRIPAIAAVDRRLFRLSKRIRTQVGDIREFIAYEDARLEQRCERERAFYDAGHQEGRIEKQASTGDGPVDAVFKAIEHITGIEVTLRDYRVRSVTVGEDAQGEAHVEAEYNGKTITARAVSTDIIEASALAFLQVINRIASRMAAEQRIKWNENPPVEQGVPVAAAQG